MFFGNTSGSFPQSGLRQKRGDKRQYQLQKYTQILILSHDGQNAWEGAFQMIVEGLQATGSHLQTSPLKPTEEDGLLVRTQMKDILLLTCKNQVPLCTSTFAGLGEEGGH